MKKARLLFTLLGASALVQFSVPAQSPNPQAKPVFTAPLQPGFGWPGRNEKRSAPPPVWRAPQATVGSHPSALSRSTGASGNGATRSPVGKLQVQPVVSPPSRPVAPLSLNSIQPRGSGPAIIAGVPNSRTARPAAALSGTLMKSKP